jgi:hypothetical protein
MLTLSELELIAKWQPYRPDWPVDRNLTDDNILKHYGQLIKDMNNDQGFECTQTQDGQMTNYLEFICYPKEQTKQAQECIMVCVSLCAPVAAYGQTRFEKNEKSLSFSFLVPETLGIIPSKQLKPIEERIVALLKKQHCEIIDKEFASKKLPESINENLDSLNFGNQVLHALFQWND